MGCCAGEARSVTVTPDLGTIPVYANDGGMLRLTPSRRQLSQLQDGIPPEIRHYGTADGTLTGTTSQPPKSTPWSYGTISWKWMTP